MDFPQWAAPRDTTAVKFIRREVQSDFYCPRFRRDGFTYPFADNYSECLIACSVAYF